MVFDSTLQKAVIAPGAVHILSMVGQLSQISQAGLKSLGDQILEDTSRLNAQASVTVQLDSVILEDGSVVGVDNASLGIQAAAMLQAEHDLFLAIASGSRTGDQLTAWLAQLASQLHPAGKVNLSSLQQRYNREQASLASVLLRFASTGAMLDYVQDTLRTKRYPSLLMNLQ